MTETLHWAGIWEKKLKMHSQAVIIGTFSPTGMPHRVAQQPTVLLYVYSRT